MTFLVEDIAQQGQLPPRVSPYRTRLLFGRSRITNRSLTFDPNPTDGRSKQARRFRDIMNEMLQLIESPSVQHEIMARRVAGLAVALEDRR